MSKWKVKPVNFDSTNPENVELYELAGQLPNFSEAVKDFLRTIRDGKQVMQLQTTKHADGSSSASFTLLPKLSE